MFLQHSWLTGTKDTHSDANHKQYNSTNWYYDEIMVSLFCNKQMETNNLYLPFVLNLTRHYRTTAVKSGCNDSDEKSFLFTIKNSSASAMIGVAMCDSIVLLLNSKTH